MLKIYNLALLAFIALSSPAAAAGASWSQRGDLPLIYQTNYLSGPKTLSPLSGTPSTAVITTVSYSWGYRAATGGLDPAYKLEAKICAGSKCGFNNANNKVGTSVTSDTYWAGTLATSNWTIAVNAYGSTTKVFSTPLLPNGGFNLTLNYSY